VEVSAGLSDSRKTIRATADALVAVDLLEPVAVPG